MTTYTVITRAYDTEPGGTVDLDPDDPGVALNVAAGVIVEGEPSAADEPRMTCPICAETMKRPHRFSSPDEIAEHYAAKHPAYAVPDWSADTSEGSEK